MNSFCCTTLLSRDKHHEYPINLSPFLQVNYSLGVIHITGEQGFSDSGEVLSKAAGRCISDTNSGCACTTALMHSPSSFLCTHFAPLKCRWNTA